MSGDSQGEMGGSFKSRASEWRVHEASVHDEGSLPSSSYQVGEHSHCTARVWFIGAGGGGGLLFQRFRLA